MSHSVEQLWQQHLLAMLDAPIRSTIITCILWNIWKARKARVFEHTDINPPGILRRTAADLQLWSHRAPPSSLRFWSDKIVHLIE
uniref:Reverse transcriptase zinc-binding domain-containing protein n=1 Tax=Setaria viridis TaxID=4556 RepID=A0A4U6WF59_SETVI|nr:hypothetical protein SEVIR_1G239301v2 [Setaria viridis]